MWRSRFATHPVEGGETSSLWEELLSPDSPGVLDVEPVVVLLSTRVRLW
jgi:hypothetical protein